MVSNSNSVIATMTANKSRLRETVPETAAMAMAPAGPIPMPTTREKAEAMVMAMVMAEDSMVIDASMMIEDSKIHHRETKVKARAPAGTT